MTRMLCLCLALMNLLLSVALPSSGFVTMAVSIPRWVVKSDRLSPDEDRLREDHFSEDVAFSRHTINLEVDEETKTKSWTCNFVSFWIQFNSRTQVFHLRERENKMGTSPVSSTSSLGRTWSCCWKVFYATLHAGFCLGVGEHERLITTAEFRRNAIIPCMLLEYFDCRSRSNRPCAAKVQNNVWWMVGKIQWSGHHPCSTSPCTETTQRLESRNRMSNDWKPSRLIPRRGHMYPSSLGVSEADNPD